MEDVFIHLLGYPSSIDNLEAPAARASVNRAVSRILELRSYERPVVLSINDLHWADSALIGLLEHLVVSLSRNRFALITAMRPGSEVDWPPLTERTTVVSLTLQPLGQVATEELAGFVAYLLGPDARFFCGSLLFCDGGTDALIHPHDLPALWESI